MAADCFSEELDLNQLLASALLLSGALSFCVCVCWRGAGEGGMRPGHSRAHTGSLASTHRCQECFPQVVTTTYVPRHRPVSPGGKNTPK